MLFSTSDCAPGADSGDRYERSDADDDAECRQDGAKPVDAERTERDPPLLDE
jgi:hypothetical protein